MNYLKKTSSSLAKYGLLRTIKKIIYTLLCVPEKRVVAAVYAKKLSQTDITFQRGRSFSKSVKFSILTPLYNTDGKMLRELLESVLGQTYQNWELCLADGSDDAHAAVGELVRSYAQKEQRILYKKLDQNRGISNNTNEALQMAGGDYFCLLDHDDILHQAALYETMCAIEEQNADMVYTDEAVFSNKVTRILTHHFKPDYAPDTLRCHNYICHFLTFSRKLYEQTGGFRAEYDGSQDYDLVLRLTQVAQKICHIPKILYFWRSHKASTAFDIGTKSYALTAAKKALAADLERSSICGSVGDSYFQGIYRITYELAARPRISILIANCDHADYLQKCISSIFSRSTYRNIQIVIIENNSVQPQTFEYYAELKKLNAEFVRDNRPERVQIVSCEGRFNYSAINNFGAKFADGQYFLLLNNDVEVITPDWLEEMLMYCQRSDVGVVGAMLYYPDNTIQHAGIIVSLRGGETGHSHRFFTRGSQGYSNRLCCTQNMSAVTGACLLTKRSVFEQVGGLDEAFAVAYNDVDYCLKARSAGYLVVWTPYAELYHYESQSRGHDFESPEKMKLCLRETALFKTKWKTFLAATDPYYNPNFTQEKENFSVGNIKPGLCSTITACFRNYRKSLRIKSVSNPFLFFVCKTLSRIKKVFRKL